MPITRREWMLAAACWSELLSAQSPLKIFTPAEAEEIRALTSTILPQTETPGANEAGTVQFIDAALSGFDRDQLPLYRKGLTEIASQTHQMFPSARRFSSLSETQRTTLLKSIEKTEFFEKLRTHTILAYFGNPQFGWKLLGRDPSMHFNPPFGFYDAGSRL